MRKLVACALLASAAMAASAPATAAQFIQQNNGPFDNKIKAFSDSDHPAEGLSVFGKTDVGDHLVKFTGNTKLSITGGTGFAQIKDFSTNDGAWNSLTIGFDTYAHGFTGLEFSVQYQGSGELELEAFFLDGSPSQKFSYNDIGGNTGFYLSAAAGEVFSHVVLSSGKAPFFQFKQAEIGIAAAPPPVPEPATWAMMIGGLGLVGAAMRRRAHTTQFA